MGQYWYCVNLERKEFVSPHKLGCGLKLWEQLANHPSTGTALIILTAVMPGRRGGGDLDMDENWHGPERLPEHNITPGPMPEEYPAVAKRTIGRWAGQKIAFVGDYAENSDLPEEFEAKSIYDKCSGYEKIESKDRFTDISDDVCRVIEHELNGKFKDDGWKKFKFDGEEEEK